MVMHLPTIQTGAIPRTWLPAPITPQSPGEKLADAALLQLLSELCAKSYHRTAETFGADSDLNFASHRRAFERGSGRTFWRPLALLLLPVNYLLISIWLLALFIPLFGLSALSEMILENQSGISIEISRWLLANSSRWLPYFTVVVAGVGLVVGTLIAFAPKLASARAFGLVQPEFNRAIVIFCGSKRFENLTINAMIWPYFGPMRHLGFHRAWSHIHADVRQWLNDMIDQAQVTEIVLTGHSLGGALAQVAAFDLSAELPVSQVVSLGSACIGGKGMRQNYSEREIPGGGRLYEGTRHFAYTGDAMPRIPPVSLFCQVGRRFRLSQNGPPIEGIPATLFRSFIRFFLRRMSFFVSFFMTTMSDVIGLMHRAVPPKRAQKFPATESIHPHGPSVHELFGHFSGFVRFFPASIPYAIFLGIIAVVAFPVIVLVTLYSYYVVAFANGLLVKHGIRNYRAAFQNYHASLVAELAPPCPGEATAIPASPSNPKLVSPSDVSA
jgi:pimeloyl-ACP methyl ester carboxylesterase